MVKNQTAGVLEPGVLARVFPVPSPRQGRDARKCLRSIGARGRAFRPESDQAELPVNLPGMSIDEIGGAKMSERDDYVRQLVEADAHIEAAENAVTQQMAQVQALRLAGKDTAGAERELLAFRETLAVLQDHRAGINNAIEQIDGGG